MGIRRTLKKIDWFLIDQLGINLRKMFHAFVRIPSFFVGYYRFSSQYSGIIHWAPCLHDKDEQAGSVNNEYFWQDLLVAQKIYDKKPDSHVDIGSRVDGFISNVACFREIDVIDIRPIRTVIPNVNFIQADLTALDDVVNSSYDSVSCLHALEHFGLGRYGDPIDCDGFLLGLRNIAGLIYEGGELYLSVPIGIERVEFNANWVFDPRTIVTSAKLARLELTELTVISQDGNVYVSSFDESALGGLAVKNYNLGVFTFVKLGDFYLSDK